MAKDKDRSLNPAAAQRKADKNKALKKAKSEQQARRNEKLARRNPERIQRQIDDLKALETSGEIKSREKAILADLERDLKAIRKARETLGDKAPFAGGRDKPQHERRNRDGDRDSAGSVLGKRRHDGQRKRYDEPSSGEETDESVRNIPMPRDTPPPMPRNRIPYNNNNPNQAHHTQNPNNIPISSTSHQHQHQQPHALPPKPTVIEAKTTYSSAPQLRDLTKEATSRFVPTVVKKKQDAIKGVGGLLEPEELDRLEKEGYLRDAATARADSESKDTNAQPKRTTNTEAIAQQNVTDRDDGDKDEDEYTRRLAEEEARFEQELGLEQTTDLTINDDDEQTDDDDRATSSAQPQQKQPTHTNTVNIIGYDTDEDGDEDKDQASTSASASSKSPNPGSSSTPSGGLFSKLPVPRSNAIAPISKQVQMEEVDDEDL